MRRPNARFYRSTLAVSIPFVGGSAGFDLEIQSLVALVELNDVDLVLCFIDLEMILFNSWYRL